jgi:membrane-bound lytic murein transglycosylase MltF
MLAPIALCVLLASCGQPSPPAPPSGNSSPASPESLDLIDIPLAPDQPISELERASETAKLDFDAIAARGYIRILVSPSRTYFETVDGRHHGRAVDIGVELASAIGQRTGTVVTAVFIPTPEHELIPKLLAGGGDVAANLLLTFERDDQVAFAPPIKTGIREIVVTGSTKPLISLEDVGGREIHVRPGTDHLASLQRLNTQLKGINRPPARIVIDRAQPTDEGLLSAVNAGSVPATIVDDYIFDLWKGQFPKTAANRDVSVSQDGSLSWVTRKDTPQLVVFLREFFTTHRIKLFL